MIISHYYYSINKKNLNGFNKCSVSLSITMLWMSIAPYLITCEETKTTLKHKKRQVGEVAGQGNKLT